MTDRTSKTLEKSWKEFVASLRKILDFKMLEIIMKNYPEIDKSRIQ